MKSVIKGAAIVGIGFCLAVTLACELAGAYERRARRRR